MFWLWIIILAVVIVGASVLIGRSLNAGPRNLSRHEQMTALKASGALKHRKSNRNN